MIRLLLAAFLLLAVLPAHATEAGWALLRDGGQVVLMRNANAPGAGDPPHFDIDNCATQRHLSDRGRQQARRIGALFAARAAPVGEVLTSRFCRCADTARLAFGTNVEPFPALDFFPDDEAGQAARNAEVAERALGYSGSDNLVMVTHAEVIEALVGVRAREGEAIILSRTGQKLGVAGRIAFN